MKKNFLKKLAFTMAFATAFTALSPAAGVFAAKAPSLTVGKKLTLLLGTDRESHDINVNNKVKGSKYTWTTSNKSVATVDKNGIVEGQKTGSAKVTLKITLPTKKTKTLTTTVDVKDNIKEVKINNAPEADLKVGVAYDFNRTIVSTFGGNKTAHKGAVTRWEVKDINAKGEVADVVSEIASADDKGNFVATEIGTYQIEAISFQSAAKYKEYLKDRVANKDLVTARSEAVKVNVGASMVAVTQKTASQFVVEFASNMKALVNKDNLVLTNKAGVKQTIIKNVTFDETGKLATVDTFLNLIDKEGYTVSYLNTSADFTASVGEAVRVTIVEPALVQYNQPKEIKVKYFDANGIEVNGTGTVKFEIVSGTNAWIDGKNITLFNIGDTVTIKAVYRTGKYDANWAEIVHESDAFQVKAVESLAAIVGGIKAWTISDKANAKDANYDKLVQSIPVGAQGRYLSVKGAKSDNSDEFVGFTFETTDSSKLIVDPSTGALVAVAVGKVTVLIKNGNFQTAVVVDVTPESKAAALTPDKNEVVVSKSIGQTATFELKLKDQYGNDLTVGAANVETLSTPSNPHTSSKLTVSGNKATFETDSNTVKGNYVYRVTVSERSTVLTIIVREAGTVATSYRVVLDNNSVDVAINNDSDGVKVVGAKVYAYDGAGVAMKDVTNEVGLTNFTWKHVTDASKTGTVTGSGITFDNTSKTGNYVVSAKYKDADNKEFNVVIGTVEVKNSQVKASYTKKEAQVVRTAGATVKDAVATAFEVKTNANASSTTFTVKDVNTTLLDSTVTAGTYDVFVRTLEVEEVFAKGKAVYTIEVNTVIKVVVK